MECKEVVDLLIDYLEHRLTPLEHKEIEAHFEACAECQTFLRTYNSTVTLIRDLRQDKIQIPEPVKERLQEFLKQHRSDRTYVQ
ncbi:MAG: zf-HC2 domain-containing protein [Acidobacteria bacterium]|nr:zf-HC2 domain-containing protein [Acidobacteriota bacterium]